MVDGKFLKQSSFYHKMQPTHVLLRAGELFLKGKNRPFFEKRLLENVRALTGIKVAQKTQGRILLPYFNEHYKLKRVMGLTSYSPVFFAVKDPEEIKKVALSILQEKKGTFRIETNRADKRFPITSPELNKQVGEYIEQHCSLTFSLKEAKHILNIEINQEGACLFCEQYPCVGGLPVGVEGRSILLVEDKNSVLAGLLMMKRGVAIYPVSIGNQVNLSFLQTFSPKELELRIFNSFAEIISFAAEKEINSLISSQRLESFNRYSQNVVVFRPLIGYTPTDLQKAFNLFNSLCSEST